MYRNALCILPINDFEVGKKYKYLYYRFSVNDRYNVYIPGVNMDMKSDDFKKYFIDMAEYRQKRLSKILES